jgi:hypothetical protein
MEDFLNFFFSKVHFYNDYFTFFNISYKGTLQKREYMTVKGQE